MKKKYFLILTYFFLSAVSCKNDASDKNKPEVDSSFKKIILSNEKLIKSTVVYSFFGDGEIKEIHKYDKNGKLSGEQLWFDSSGILQRKLTYINGKAEGNGYFFYPTGTMLGQRFYRNDNQVFHGINYWDDSLPMEKSILHIDDSGNVYYQKNYDRNGNFLNEEGRKNR